MEKVALYQFQNIMLNYSDNEETIKRVKEIDEKLHEDNLDGKEYTKLMFEQLLRGISLNVL